MAKVFAALICAALLFCLGSSTTVTTAEVEDSLPLEERFERAAKLARATSSSSSSSSSSVVSNALPTLEERFERAAKLARATSSSSSSSSSSVVSNALPRVDHSTGEILDVHDGTTLRIGDLFFFYGASYGGCQEQSSGCASGKVGACGFQLNHTVSLALSSDLVSWFLVGVVLAVEDRPQGIIFSPWVARSPSTGDYVLWFNVLPVVGGSGDFDDATYAIASSPSPQGPFMTVVANVSGVGYARLPDAPSIFVDDDGQGYVAFTHEDSHINNVQRLSPDLLSPLPGPGNISAVIGPGNNEGVVMFKRDGVYYVGFGQCCCFCAGGTDVTLYTASSPLGPYALSGTIASASNWGAQTGSVWYTGVDWVLYGDRWQSAPDSIKGHDFSYMAPLAFNADGTVQHLPPGLQSNVTISY